MSAVLIDRLSRCLRRAEAQHPDLQGYVLGLSGGIDSVVLLAAMCRAGYAQRLRCLHVDHAWHEDSGRWAQFCASLAAEAGVAFHARRLEHAAPSGSSLEAAARQARYAVFAEELRPGEALLSAHHADDQLETLLYRLLRGTGVEGLRGIRSSMPLGHGYLLRPWLDVTRAEIHAQALQWGLRWLDDPSNDDARFDRNYLRREVLPVVLRRWPAAAAAAGRLVAAAGDAAELAGDLARQDLAGSDTLDCLPLELLERLAGARRRNVLRFALASLDLPVPDAAALRRVEDLLNPQPAHMHAAWPGGEAHRWDSALYLRAPRPPLPQPSAALHPGQVCPVGEGLIELEPGADAPLPEDWVHAGLEIRFRSGGESFQPPGSRAAMPLREWMRSRRVLPWMRDRIPLVFCGTQLVAVADICVCAAAASTRSSARRWRITWRNRPRVSAPELTER